MKACFCHWIGFIKMVITFIWLPNLHLTILTLIERYKLAIANYEVHFWGNKRLLQIWEKVRIATKSVWDKKVAIKLWFFLQKLVSVSIFTLSVTKKNLWEEKLPWFMSFVSHSKNMPNVLNYNVKCFHMQQYGDNRGLNITFRPSSDCRLVPLSGLVISISPHTAVFM